MSSKIFMPYSLLKSELEQVTDVFDAESYLTKEHIDRIKNLFVFDDGGLRYVKMQDSIDAKETYKVLSVREYEEPSKIPDKVIADNVILSFVDSVSWTLGSETESYIRKTNKEFIQLTVKDDKEAITPISMFAMTYELYICLGVKFSCYFYEGENSDKIQNGCILSMNSNITKPKAEEAMKLMKKHKKEIEKNYKVKMSFKKVARKLDDFDM
jgi:hypothetical protein